VEKHGTARQNTDDNIVQCMHFAWQIIEAIYTYSEYVNTYCFSMATMVTQRHLNATLYEIACVVDLYLFYIRPFLQEHGSGIKYGLGV
jgi:hypothetical protein